LASAARRSTAGYDGPVAGSSNNGRVIPAPLSPVLRGEGLGVRGRRLFHPPSPPTPLPEYRGEGSRKANSEVRDATIPLRRRRSRWSAASSRTTAIPGVSSKSARKASLIALSRFGDGRFVAVGSYGGATSCATKRVGRARPNVADRQKRRQVIRALCAPLVHGKELFLASAVTPAPSAIPSHSNLNRATAKSGATSATIAGKNILRRVAWGNDRYVGVGDRGRRATSKDGRDWQECAGREGH